jgi:hypothetical protein
MRRFVDLLLLLALLLLMVYMVQARDTDGDGILDAGKMLLNQIIFFFDTESISKFYALFTLFIERLSVCTALLELCKRAVESKSLNLVNWLFTKLNIYRFLLFLGLLAYWCQFKVFVAKYFFLPLEKFCY